MPAGSVSETPLKNQRIERPELAAPTVPSVARPRGIRHHRYKPPQPGGSHPVAHTRRRTSGNFLSTAAIARMLGRKLPVKRLRRTCEHYRSAKREGAAWMLKCNVFEDSR